MNLTNHSKMMLTCAGLQKELKYSGKEIIFQYLGEVIMQRGNFGPHSIQLWFILVTEKSHPATQA